MFGDDDTRIDARINERKEKILKEREQVWQGAYNAAITSSNNQLTLDDSRWRVNAWANTALEDFDKKFSK